MPPIDSPDSAGSLLAPAGQTTRLEQRLALACALLLCASVFLLPGRGAVAHLARLALLLFPVAGLLVWVFLPAARQAGWRTTRGGAAGNTWLWIGLPLLAYFITALAGKLVHGDSSVVLDKPVRMLVLSVGLFIWLHIRMDLAFFRHVAVLFSIAGGFLAFGVALYERFALGIDRVGVQPFPIQFADMAMSIALVCAAWVAGLPKSALRMLASISVALAFVACWMASSRGAFIALLVLPWVVAWASGRRLTLKRALAVLAGVLVVLAVGLASNTRLRERVVEVRTDLQAYAQGRAATSLGMRLQMWQNSLHVFAASPAVGAGTAGYLRSQEQGVAQGRLDPAILEFNGAHNQYLDALAKGGLLHGLSTLALFLFPWLWFRRRSRQPSGVPLHAVAGFAVASAFPLFALSQHVLNHGSGAMFFAGSMVLFALACAPQYGTIPANPTASGNPP
ncbi:MAG: O-antigen ligase family protein [Pseudomonadota bacterium]